MSSASSIKENINDKIYARNLPSVILAQPSSFQLNQQNTRYQTHTSNGSIENIYYNQEQIFLPGSHAPRLGYIDNLDKEAILRNQLYPLQKGDMQCKVACVNQVNESPQVKSSSSSSSAAIVPYPSENVFMNPTRLDFKK